MAESPKRRADLSQSEASHSQADNSKVTKPVQPASPPTSETARAADSVPAPIGPFATLPMRFGRYEIRKELGRGQMGAVYLAKDVELDRLVALKVARISASGSAKILKRMEVEAKAAAKIDHPLICKVYDAGEIDGIRFIALQYIEGENLKQYMKRVGSKRPAEEAVRLVLQILRALEAAHAQGVIHRDLKPENVMLNKNRDPVIMDFGLARRTIASSNAGLTQGMIVGTAAYMSPEQTTGKAEEIDHRSDIYAVGVMLFEMLTGEWPFTGGMFEVMGKKCVQEPPSPLNIDSTLNPKLAAVCHKMIAKNKVDRFVACAEVIIAIESVNSSTESPIQAKDESAKTESPFSFDFTNEPQAALSNRKASKSVSKKNGVLHKPTFDVFTFATRYWTGATPVVRRAALVGAGACLLVLAVILFFPTPHGVVKIEIDDPTLKVKFQGSTITVDNDNQPIHVTATARHTLEVLQNNVTVESATRELTLKKGESRILKVTLLDGKIIVVDGDSPSVAPLQKTLERILDGPIVLEPVVPPVDRSQNVELSRDAPLTIGFETPAFQRWTNEVAALPAEKQVEAVSKKLQELNPGFDGKLFGIEMTGTPKIENGHVKTMCFFADDIIDISPVRVLKELDSLWCNGSSTGKGKVSDLSPLKGMKLRQLRCIHTQVSDLSPLGEMTSLDYLHVSDTKVSNLSPLEGLRLGTFHCGGTPIKDLTPLKGIPLHALSIDRSQVSDLSPLKGLKLRYIDFGATQVADLSPLNDMPLVEVRFGGTPVFNLSPLREMRSLKVIRCPATTVADLSPLKGLNLSVVDIWKTAVSDLSPLREMKLTYLDIYNTKVSDLSPLQGQPLAILRCRETAVSDLSPLRGMPLTEITLASKNIDIGMDVLRPMETLKTIKVNDKHMSPDEFWKRYDAGEFGKPAGGHVLKMREASAVEQPRENSWKILFNSKNLTGWTVDGGTSSQWSVEGGEIVGRSQSYKTRCYVLADGQYADYVMRFEFNLVGENAHGGVAIRGLINETVPYEGMRIFDHPIIKLWNHAKGNEVTGTANWVKSTDVPVRPNVALELGPDIWHKMEVWVQGDHCTAKVGETQIVDLTLDRLKTNAFTPALDRPNGKIGFQINTGTLRLRKIEVKELGSK